MRNHPNWMGDLITAQSPYASKPINLILIPGTHDSGTYGMYHDYRTQSLTIKQQLEAGVRYLDCRVMKTGNSFYFHHTMQSPNMLGSVGDTPAKQPYGVLNDIRNFLIAYPKEIIILKFQNITDFWHDDYTAFMQLLKDYLVIEEAASKCELVKLQQNTAEYIGRESISSLNDSHKRVFIFFDVTNVPTDEPTASDFWEYAFKYEPGLLTKGNYGLWDPFWGDDGSGISPNDTDNAHMQLWWDWQDKNRVNWIDSGSDAGFYVLQSQMAELNGTLPYPMYYNISEQVADSTYYMAQVPSTGDYISNNTRNIQHYLDSYKSGNPFNILMFDYIQHGDICDIIIDFYTNYAPPAFQPVHYNDHIKLKLNGLDIYVSPTYFRVGYFWPDITDVPGTLYLRKQSNLNDTSVIRDGDTVILFTVNSYEGQGDFNKLSVYDSKPLYYYNETGQREQWIIRKGQAGAEIYTGDYIWLENVDYPNQMMTIYNSVLGTGLNTETMSLPTRWIIDKV